MLFYRNFYDFRLLKFTSINQHQQTSLPNKNLLDRLFLFSFLNSHACQGAVFSRGVRGGQKVLVLRFPTTSENRKTKSFPFSALILLRRLFFLRTSAKCASTLCSRFVVSSVFPLQAKTEKQKVFRFPLSVFRFFVSLCQSLKIWQERRDLCP